MVKRCLATGGCSANLEVGSMVNLPYEDGYFDVIFDVFSAASLYEEAFLACLDDVSRCLKAGGRFFSYSPSDKSDAYKKHSPAKKIDPWTLDGIKRIDSAYYGQAYPFRFISKDHYKEVLLERNFNVSYLESVGRTYSSGNEYFEFITVAGEKNRLHS
ncbi:MAG: class I SAM-dependent methyltransferase [bacterium]|nr:class I SAM-dependent methyltransferase [bacterium]